MLYEVITVRDPYLGDGEFYLAHKLAILTSLAYGMEINFNDIYIESYNFV